MMEVEITNFQAWSNVKFVIDGFTTLVGRNFLGKSALLRAVNAALTNQQGTDFIKWGEVFCEVHLKTSSMDILWHKEEGNNFYEINGTKYEKIGRDAPPKILQDAGFGMVNVGSQKVNIAYGVQFSPLFLVDRQDAKGIDLLTSMYGLDRLYKALEFCNKAQRDVNDNIKIRELDLNIVEKELEKFEGWEAIKSGVDALKIPQRSIEDRENELVRLKSCQARIDNLKAICSRLEPVCKIVLPNPDTLRKPIHRLQDLRIKNEKVNSALIVLKKLKACTTISLPSKECSLTSKAVDELNKLKDFKNRYEDLDNKVKQLQAIENVRLPALDLNIKEVEKLHQYQQSISRIRSTVKELKTEYETTTKRLEEVTTQRNKYERCPVCGSELKKHDTVSHVQ